MNYRRTDNPDYTASTEKDILIATMKKELYQIRDLEHEHSKLVDEVKNLESKYSMLQEDNLRTENELKIKSDINRTTITQLRNQLDGFKIQIHKCSVQIDDTLRETANLKRVCDNRQNQIAAQISYNQELQKSNQEQAEINNSLSSKIRSLKEERNRAENECERLHRLLDENINILKNLEKEARSIQSSNQKHESIIHLAENDHSDLVDDLKSREEQVSLTNQKLNRLKQEREELKQKTNKLDKQCIKSESDLRNVVVDLEAAIAKNKELANKLKNEEKILRKSQGEIEQANIKKQSLTKEYNNAVTEHNLLDADIDRCMISILEYEKINQELQRSVRHFIECDEEARTMLNRKEAMGQMLEQVLAKLHKTGDEIAHLRNVR